MQFRSKPTKRYWNAYASLYGDETAVEPKPRKKRNRSEELEQEKFNAWFDEFLWPIGYRWFHPANGGSRNPIEGAKFKRLGVKRGVPDVVLPMAKKSYHGLVIEFKRIDGKMSDLSVEQEEWLEWFKGQKWSVNVAFGFDHAKQIVIDYFS